MHLSACPPCSISEVSQQLTAHISATGGLIYTVNAGVKTDVDSGERTAINKKIDCVGFGKTGMTGMPVFVF